MNAPQPRESPTFRCEEEVKLTQYLIALAVGVLVGLAVIGAGHMIGAEFSVAASTKSRLV